MNEILTQLRAFGAGRLAAILGVGLGVALALGLIVARIGEAPLAILYSDLDLRDGEAIVSQLEQDGAEFEVRESAGRITVLAPRADIARLKVSLAAGGFVARGGGVGYEIFDTTDAFGATSFQQNINRLRALEGEIGRSISTISGVRSARVHLALPERELFTRDRKPASASIVIDAPGGLDARAVRAIVNLTASAVPELAPARVTILDAAGQLLASGAGDSDMMAGGVDERTASAEARIRRMVEDILTPIVGAENLRVQISADLDFNRVTEAAEIIDPDSQTVLSSTIVEEAGNSADPAGALGVTIANALPGAEAVDPASSALATSSNRRTEETTNYLVSRTQRNAVREQGGMRRLSVAVALNAAAGPRTPEELARISSLVRSAVGFSPRRGDQIEVVEVAFQAPVAKTQPLTGPSSPVTLPDAMRLIEVGALAVMGFALIFFVLRPMLASAGAGGLLGRPAPATGGDASGGAIAAPGLSPSQPLAISQILSEKRPSSARQVAEQIRGYNDEAAGLLKSWIRQS